MIVYDVLVGTHRHHCCLDLNLVQNVLLRHLHHPHGPTLIRILTIEGLVDGTHGSLSQLFRETIEFVGVVGQKMDFLYLLIELLVSHQCVVRDFVFLLQSSNNLNHHLRIFLDELFIDVVFSK
jgi:hypothetical protein